MILSSGFDCSRLFEDHPDRRDDGAIIIAEESYSPQFFGCTHVWRLRIIDVGPVGHMAMATTWGPIGNNSCTHARSFPADTWSAASGFPSKLWVRSLAGFHSLRFPALFIGWYSELPETAGRDLW